MHAVCNIHLTKYDVARERKFNIYNLSLFLQQSRLVLYITLSSRSLFVSNICLMHHHHRIMVIARTNYRRYRILFR